MAVRLRRVDLSRVPHIQSCSAGRCRTSRACRANRAQAARGDRLSRRPCTPGGFPLASAPDEQPEREDHEEQTAGADPPEHQKLLPSSGRHGEGLNAGQAVTEVARSSCPSRACLAARHLAGQLAGDPQGRSRVHRAESDLIVVATMRPVRSGLGNGAPHLRRRELWVLGFDQRRDSSRPVFAASALGRHVDSWRRDLNRQVLAREVRGLARLRDRCHADHARVVGWERVRIMLGSLVP